MFVASFEGSTVQLTEDNILMCFPPSNQFSCGHRSVCWPARNTGYILLYWFFFIFRLPMQIYWSDWSKSPDDETINLILHSAHTHGLHLIRFLHTWCLDLIKYEAYYLCLAHAIPPRKNDEHANKKIHANNHIATDNLHICFRQQKVQQMLHYYVQQIIMWRCRM